MINYKNLTIRFYEELNDFLRDDLKKIRFEHNFIDRSSVKDLIESFGIPHTEVDLILVNGKSVSFDYIINDKDDISVYPVFESFEVSDVQHLRPAPLRNPKFICDVHLGKLARYLRMTGLDTAYTNDLSDNDVVKISVNEKRAILTRDIELLKRTDVTHGYYVRNTVALEQLKEIINRFQLINYIKEFTRCLNCNSMLDKIKKEEIEQRLPPKVRERQNDFFICYNCDKIFWKGSHYKNMINKIESIINI